MIPYLLVGCTILVFYFPDDGSYFRLSKCENIRLNMQLDGGQKLSTVQYVCTQLENAGMKLFIMNKIWLSGKSEEAFFSKLQTHWLR